MTYVEPNLTSGIDEALVSTAKSVPSFIVFMLIFIWFVIFISGIQAQKKRTGSADKLMWAVLSGIVCSIVSLILSLREGLMRADVLGIVFGFTILCALLFYLEKAGIFE